MGGRQLAGAHMTALAALCGAPPARLPRALRPGPGGAIRRLDRGMLRLGLAVGAGVLVGAITRWPVGALLAAGAGAFLPDLAGGQAAQQAAVATAPLAPRPDPPTGARPGRASGAPGARLVPALHAFADELADPTADLVVAALVLSSQRQARRVGELLGALARAARDDATMRLRVEAGRARTRTSARVVVGVTLAMAVGLVVLNRGYLAPYDSAFGQLIMAGVGGLFGTAFWWLARMARVEAPQRLLGGDLEDGTEGVAR